MTGFLGGWGEFVLAFAVFLGSHAIPSRPGLKARLVGLLGQWGYILVFSLASVAILAWMIVAAGRAPFVPLWDQAPWHRWAANVAMPVAVLFGTFAVGAVNPLSFFGRSEGFDPEHPGVAGLTRHPLLVALLIWALAHLLVNGDLAHAILFGSFALVAVAGMGMIDRRNRRIWGPERWAAMTAHTANLPFAALLSGRWRPRRFPSPLRLALAAVIWIGLLHLHPPVIGVSPLP